MNNCSNVLHAQKLHKLSCTKSRNVQDFRSEAKIKDFFHCVVGWWSSRIKKIKMINDKMLRRNITYYWVGSTS